MASTQRYTLKARRRRQGKTDYRKRLSLLKSRQTRLVIRKSNANTTVQLVRYEPDGDVVVAQASTSQLSALGWKGSTGNLPAAYLAGYLAGARAKKAKVKSAIVDIGMQRAFHGGRLFAAVKGVIDAGVSVAVNEEALPSEERVSGAHISEKLASQVADIKKKAGA